LPRQERAYAAEKKELPAPAVERVVSRLAEEAEKALGAEDAPDFAKDAAGDRVAEVVEREAGVDGIEGCVPEGKRLGGIQSDI
jgi:hypothetical protein